MYCPHCGHLNADGALYCTNCGTRLVGGNPANPAASNPEATASFPRVVTSPAPTREAGTDEARPTAGVTQTATNTTASATARRAPSNATGRRPVAPTQGAPSEPAPEPQERARRVVRSKRPHHNHAAANETRAQSAAPLAGAYNSTTPQTEPANATRVVSAGATQVVPAEPTRVVPTDATRVAASDTARVAPGDATRVAPAAANTSYAPGSSTVVAPPAAPTGTYSGEGFAAENSQHRTKRGYGLVAGVIVAVIAVALIGVAVFAGSSTQGNNSPAPAAAPTQQEPASPTSTDAGNSTANESSQGSASNTSSTKNSTNEKSEGAGANSSAADSQSANSSEGAGNGSTSGDIVDNGNGTVSSKTYGYTISMPSQFSQQSGDETGATYYDPTDDVTISLWGDNNPTGATMESAYNSAKSSAASGDYVAHGKNWVVYSTDNADSGVVYDMTYYQNGKTCHMHISYPMSSKQAGDAIIERVQPTFKLNS